MKQEYMGISGKVSHDPTLTRKYNALLEMLGVEGMLHQIEQYMDDSDLESIVKYIENETLPKLIFQDVDGNELRIGDVVVMLDIEDLDSPPPRGAMLVVNGLLELDTNYISASSHCFYGHRVLKVSKH
jgi:hypothetical protein